MSAPGLSTTRWRTPRLHRIGTVALYVAIGCLAAMVLVSVALAFVYGAQS